MILWGVWCLHSIISNPFCVKVTKSIASKICKIEINCYNIDFLQSAWEIYPLENMNSINVFKPLEQHVQKTLSDFYPDVFSNHLHKQVDHTKKSIYANKLRKHEAVKIRTSKLRFVIANTFFCVIVFPLFFHFQKLRKYFSHPLRFLERTLSYHTG